jgi:hypothetical protein
MRRLPLLALSVLVLTTACSSSWNTFRANGLSIRYPKGWSASSHRLTPVTSPPQVLAIGSYTLPDGSRGANGCQPKEALDRMPSSGVFIFGWEYSGGVTGLDFPPRPRHFRLTGFADYECLGPSYLLRFRVAGRFFQIHVAFGPHASASTRATALRVLDSLKARTNH